MALLHSSVTTLSQRATMQEPQIRDIKKSLTQPSFDLFCYVQTMCHIQPFYGTRIHTNQLTWTMAGSWGRLLVALGGSQTVRSFISLPRKMMYSNTSSRGGIGLSVGRSSVPKERTVGENSQDKWTDFTLLVCLLRPSRCMLWCRSLHWAISPHLTPILYTQYSVLFNTSVKIYCISSPFL